MTDAWLTGKKPRHLFRTCHREREGWGGDSRVVACYCQEIIGNDVCEKTESVCIFALTQVVARHWSLIHLRFLTPIKTEARLTLCPTVAAVNCQFRALCLPQSSLCPLQESHWSCASLSHTHKHTHTYRHKHPLSQSMYSHKRNQNHATFYYQKP